ncbi:MAG: two-component sensor histidine kinase [Desulfobacterales bacterium]|nr:two-component sensor histidine kinase [Desulfobacterales bacterium]
MKKYRYSSLKRIILLNMIFVPVIPFILSIGIGYYYFISSLENSAITAMSKIVEDHKQMIESFLEERRSDLEFLLYAYSLEELKNPDKLKGIFESLQKKSSAFVDLGVFDENGVHIAYEGPFNLSGRIYKNESWFIEVLKNGYFISDIFLGFRKVPHFIISVSKEFQGQKWIIRSTIDTYTFTNIVKSVRIGKTGESYILNSEGIFQTERRSGGNLMDKDVDFSKYLTSINSINTFIENDSKGDKYLYTTIWMKDKKWLLVVRQEKADAFKALRSASYLIILISIIGGAFIIGQAFYLTGRIVKKFHTTDTEKVELQDQLIRASRLAEIGEMAAGFAHEINNPLQIIKSEQSLIEIIFSDLKKNNNLQKAKELSEIEDSLSQIGLQIGRCAKITQAILKFARLSEPVFQDMDLKQFIPEISGMIAKKARVNGIEIQQSIKGNTPNIYGDPGQLQQVLLNLLNNAIDAVVERHGAKGGEIIIEAGLNSDGKVELSVKDNGSGINPENQKKVFSPFFTTKPVGKGTGLGLSVCYGIINNMGGVMEFTSEKNLGTTFTINFPIRQ